MISAIQSLGDLRLDSKRLANQRSSFFHLISAWALPVALIFFFAFARPVQGQVSQASIRGNVHDATKAVVRDATLKLINVDTRVESATTVNDNGD